MATAIIMPDFGTTVEQVKLVRWLKAVGDPVKRGDMLCEVETDKATSELESIADGVLLKQVVPEGEDVQQGTVIAYVGAAGEAPPVAPAKPAGAGGVAGGSAGPVAPRTGGASGTPGGASGTPGGASGTPGGASGTPGGASGTAASPGPQSPARQAGPTARQAGPTRISPMIRRLAEREGVDLANVAATGAGGLVTREDVLRAKAGGPATAAQGRPAAPTAPGAVSSRLFPKEQLAVARTVARSNREIPTIDLTASIDMSAVIETRQTLIRQSARKISFDAFFVRAVAESIKRFPSFAAHADDEHFFPHEAIDVCLAVSHDRKLYLPAVRGADRLTLAEIQAEIERIVERIRGGRVSLAELSGGCMTVSNLGMFPVESFQMIIPPEQSAALAVGQTQERPMVHDGRIVVRPLAIVALSVDHRMINGAEAAEFLGSLKKTLETP